MAVRCVYVWRVTVILDEIVVLEEHRSENAVD